MKRVAAVAVLTTAILGMTAPALARTSHTTNFVYDTSQPLSASTSKTYLVGHLTSNEPKCLRHRKVRVAFAYETESGARDVDFDLTSDKGSASGIGPTEHDGHALVGAGMFTKAKTLKNGDTCSSAEFSVG